MSYDIDVGDEWFNYTSNLAPLFYDHMPASHDEARGGLHELDGCTGKQAAEIIGDAFERLHHSYVGGRTFRAKYDADNGWGSTDGALIFLGRIMAACLKNPRKLVRVSA